MRSHLEIRRRLQEAHDLIAGQNGGQGIRLAAERNVLSHVGVPERGLEEESDAAHDRNDGGRLQAARDQVQLILAHVLEGQLVRRFHEVPAEVLHGADVGLLGVRRHVADRHVVDHALSQRRELLCHGRAPVDGLSDPAIVADRMRAGEARFPRRMFVGKGRKSSIFRPMRNGSVEPFAADRYF